MRHFRSVDMAHVVRAFDLPALPSRNIDHRQAIACVAACGLHDLIQELCDR
jgi:hypothetical protein